MEHLVYHKMNSLKKELHVLYTDETPYRVIFIPFNKHNLPNMHNFVGEWSMIEFGEDEWRWEKAKVANKQEPLPEKKGLSTPEKAFKELVSDNNSKKMEENTNILKEISETLQRIEYIILNKLEFKEIS